MVKMYYDSDCNLSLIKGKKVAIIGYGFANNIFEKEIFLICHFYFNCFFYFEFFKT